MKTIHHSYSADLNWVEPFAKQFGGKVEGNFIIIPEDLQSGTRYFYDCGDGIIAYYINVEYKKTFHLIQRNENKDFVGIYYNLTDGEASVSSTDFTYNFGRWQYNLAVIDGNLESSYKVKNGSKTFALCIFIKRSNIEEYAKKNNIQFHNMNRMVDPSKNTIVRFDRMSNESFHLLDDLRKLKTGGSVFNLNLVGTVHLLISNYLKKIASNRIIIQTVNETDLANIINIQMYLIDNVEGHFPSIKMMASMANMSESKFKNLFRKITGITPNVFFMDNKLLLAKNLLEKKQLSISEISYKLHFTNNSYFASKFKQHFGLSPKTFIKQL
ncbi:helix-turn-helix transcriptional regulator [Flavobacterium sp. JLP]|uniref:helix-turn-helix transcriptional regulator n=1 Tax=unclassified Flavobacterium TaxID=196869 RepID=UPI00188AC438|nr:MULTISPECIES: AraC family transcriptional regulator [unclassified Flavobacterium]MBF4494774.1 helix-turn-helix transcriptional regulator [Flavobacterium sp. MR2016-29]MBF4507847.1 helix-turn-helix transcriptional regulator [Flavobacterium sp. JLP]